jgi:hypothetical protein
MASEEEDGGETAATEGTETAAVATPETPPLARRRAFLLYGAPLLGLLLLLVVLPLARGLETLYLRDVLNTHFEMKWVQAQAMRAGYFPLIDPYRSGGQPLAGNPNAVPFYPDNVLYLIGSVFWALNAHFWLHLLLAPLAFYAMARAWGLRRDAAWAGAVCWTVSGFFLSHLSFYNLIAGVTLAPALVAACLRFAEGRRKAVAPLIAILWGLLLLGGDPLMALLALALAGAALLPWLIASVRRREAWPDLALLAACFLCGSLLALPQIVEFRRILPISFRGHRGYSPEVATVASWDPRQIAEWLIPFVFGRPDLLADGSFWGSRFFTGVPPYYLSLYPGLLALALVAAAGLPRRGRIHPAEAWAWGSVAVGLFLSLGRFNPVAVWLFSLPGRASLRYPVKFWLPVAAGAALLCAIGFGRLLSPEPEEAARARRRFGLALLGLALALGGTWAYLTLSPGPAEAWIKGVLPAGKPAPFIAYERLRWAGLCFLSLLLLAALALLARLARRRPATGGALLLAAHALAQLLVLRPLYPTDQVVPYRVPPPALARVPKSALVVNADFNYLFGPSTLKQGTFPDAGARWMERRAFYELYPFTGPMWQRRYELNESAEGLDTFLARMAEGAVKASSDEERVRLLAAWGVGRLLMNHPLDPVPSRARLVATVPSFGKTLWIYEVIDPAPRIFLARRVFRAPHLNAAYRDLTLPDFDARGDVVLPGDGPPQLRAGGRVHVVRQGPESLELETLAGVRGGGSVLVVQRAHHLWRATIDGKPAEVHAANLYRLGVEVPPGRHRVRLWLDRRPLALSFLGVALALAALPGLAWWGGRRRLLR